MEKVKNHHMTMVREQNLCPETIQEIVDMVFNMILED